MSEPKESTPAHGPTTSNPLPTTVKKTLTESDRGTGEGERVQG